MTKKILIIEDERNICELLSHMLKGNEYETVIALTGADGLRLSTEELPNLIILDVMMESVDKGFDVARNLKNDKNHQDIPILMLTAIKEKTGLGFEKEAGDPDWLPVDGYCEKPLKPEELISKVKELLGKR